MEKSFHYLFNKFSHIG